MRNERTISVAGAVEPNRFYENFSKQTGPIRNIFA